ncbi:FecR family protein [Methylomonas sp. AM2-LC]|uniref:FecR family protein n=1 Tax=Methylomonas sp. AM2-LC TaxID=3153301 RepID=UPI00326376BC
MRINYAKSIEVFFTFGYIVKVFLSEMKCLPYIFNTKLAMRKPINTIFSEPASEQDNLIAEQALDWFTHIQTGGLSAEEKIEFEVWKSQNPAHQQAYNEAAQLWSDADFNQALTLSRLSYTTLKTQRKHKLWNRTLPLALAASFVFCLILFDPITKIQADYYTSVGETQTVQLKDGSSITLNTDTAISVAYKNDERYIHLLKGEAYFDVQPDTTKPFVVDSGNTETRVLGTRFIVQETQTEDKITVIKGLVQVSNVELQQRALLHPDQQVTNTNAGLTAVQSIINNQHSTWLNGRLSFQDTPLADVIREMDRYLPGVILFSDSHLKTYRINARFDLTQPILALDTLEQTLPIKITHVTNWLTVISQL